MSTRNLSQPPDSPASSVLPLSPGMIRAEWAVLLFALVLPTLATYGYFIILSGHPMMKVAYPMTKVIQFSLPLVWVWAVRREPRKLGWPTKAGLGLGLFFGILVVVATEAIYYGLLKESASFARMPERLAEKVSGMGALSPVRFLLLGAFISFIHSFLEEYYWRWFVFGRLRTLVPFGAAVVISSLGFMSHHVLVLGAYLGWEHWPMVAFLSLCVAVGGAFWAWLYARTGSLVAPWISHMLVDCALIAVGYDQLRKVVAGF